MPAPYSDDLRQKVLAAVDRGERKSHVCRLFNISRNTLHLWLKRRESIGSISAIQRYPRGPQTKISDLQAFHSFAQRYGHLTQREMAQQWSEPVSDRTIARALKRIGFTRKKRLMAIEKEMKPRDKLSSTNCKD